MKRIIVIVASISFFLLLLEWGLYALPVGVLRGVIHFSPRPIIDAYIEFVLDEGGGDYFRSPYRKEKIIEALDNNDLPIEKYEFSADILYPYIGMDMAAKFDEPNLEEPGRYQASRILMRKQGAAALPGLRRRYGRDSGAVRFFCQRAQSMNSSQASDPIPGC